MSGQNCLSGGSNNCGLKSWFWTLNWQPNRGEGRPFHHVQVKWIKKTSRIRFVSFQIFSITNTNLTQILDCNRKLIDGPTGVQIIASRHPNGSEVSNSAWWTSWADKTASMWIHLTPKRQSPTCSSWNLPTVADNRSSLFTLSKEEERQSRIICSTENRSSLSAIFSDLQRS